MSDPPIQPDDIRAAPGEPLVPSDNLRYRYACTCKGKVHAHYLHHDETPPETCLDGSPVYRDHKWIDPTYTPPPQSERPSGRTNYNWDMQLEDQRQLEGPR